MVESKAYFGPDKCFIYFRTPTFRSAINVYLPLINWFETI